MIVEDIIFSNEKSLNTKDPYKKALHILNVFSDFGKIIERRNEFETDGPRQRCFVSFDVVDDIDNFTSHVYSFDISGEKTKMYGILNISMKFIIRTNIRETGFFSHIFSDYYIENILPFMRKSTMHKMKSIIKKCEKQSLD